MMVWLHAMCEYDLPKNGTLMELKEYLFLLKLRFSLWYIFITYPGVWQLFLTVILHICTYQTDQEMCLDIMIFSSLRLWYPELAFVSAICCVFGGFERKSLTVGPLCTGLLNAWLSLAGFRHIWMKPSWISNLALQISLYSFYIFLFNVS